jgi:hypothetical protein
MIATLMSRRFSLERLLSQMRAVEASSGRTRARSNTRSSDLQ